MQIPCESSAKVTGPHLGMLTVAVAALLVCILCAMSAVIHSEGAHETARALRDMS